MWRGLPFALTLVLMLAFGGCESDDGESGPLVLDDTFTVGSFQVSITQSDASPVAMQIVHSSNADKVLFETVSGVPFVAAGKGNVKVTELRGSFTIEDRVDTLCESPVITGAKLENNELRLDGQFDDEGCDLMFELVFSSDREKRLGFELGLQNDTDFNQLFLRYASEEDERFYGFGTQFTHLNVKGRSFPVITQDNGIGRGLEGITELYAQFGSGGDWYTSYIATPQYITNTGKSLFLENREVAIFNFEDADVVEIKLLGTRLKGNILSGSTPAELITEFTEYTGRMGPLPDWIHQGAIVGLQGGDEKVLAQLAALETQNTPIAAFWLQDWVGKRQTGFGSQLWWNWELNPEAYPGWDEMLSTLKSKNIRVMTYISPKLADNVADQEDYKPTRNLFQEAAEKNYLVRNQSGEPYKLLNTDFSASLIDFTNPEAWDWYKQVIKEQVLAVGASGWMADFSEALPFDAVLASGIDGSVYHNQYVEDWARINREVLQDEELEDDVVFFMRAGFTSSPRYSTLFWLGDQLVTWDTYDGLKSAVKGMLSGGLSGFSLNHSDIGGYTTVTGKPETTAVRTKELLMRWMEKSAFTVAFRNHEGNKPEKNAQFYTDQETYEHFAKFAKVFAALAPYRKQLVDEASKTGLPVARHPLIEYPEDPVAWDLEYQWMLGADFMIAPVVDEGATELNVYLPAGEWVHLWSGKEMGSASAGGWVEIKDAVLGQPPVFYKKGSQAAAEFLAKLAELGVME